MRRPKQPKDKQDDVDRQPPGGRAWQRVEQFARSRGLPTDPAPTTKDESPRASKKSPLTKRK